MFGHGDGLAEVLAGAFAREQRLQFVQCGGVAAQHGEGGGERVEVGVAALEVAAAGGLLEGGAGVQQAGVVEDQAVAGAEPELQLEFRAQGDLREAAVRGVEGVEFGAAEAAQGVDGAVVEADLADRAARVESDHRHLGGQVGGPVAVAERHRRAGEQRERLRVLRAQQRRRAEAVHQPGVAAGGVVAQAVQQLEGGDGVAVRVVGVRGDGGVGEREVHRVGLHPDVEQLAVVGVPDVAERPCHGEDSALLDGDAAEHREAGAADGGEDGDPLLGVGQVGRPVGLGQAAGEVGGLPQALAVLGAVVAEAAVLVPRVPAGRVAGAVAVGPQHVQARRVLEGLGGGQAVRQVADPEPLLPAARVAALGARAVVAQPVGVGDGHRSSLQLYRQLRGFRSAKYPYPYAGCPAGERSATGGRTCRCAALACPA